MLATGYVLLEAVVNLIQIVSFAVGLSWMTVHLLANKAGMKKVFLVVSTKRRDLDSVSAVDDDALLWSTGDAVHSPSQLRLLGALPNQAQSHFHAAQTSN